MSEEGLREAFRQVAEGVKIAPDPYTRLMRRHRGRQRMRAAGWTTALTGAVTALLLGPVVTHGLTPDLLLKPSTGPSASARQGQPLTPWIQSLINSPTRGALASDEALIEGLAIRLMRLDYGELPGSPVKVLFAEDIGELRIAIAARFSETRYTGIYIAGKRGDSLEQLSVLPIPDATVIFAGPMAPYVPYGYSTIGADVSFSGVSLAPAGCQLSTAQQPTDGESGWSAAPTKDYLIWPHSVAGELYVRVTCGGIARFEGHLIQKGHYFVRRPANANEGVDAALKETRGSVPHRIAVRILHDIPPDATGPTRILYGGPMPGVDQTVYLSVNPAGPEMWGVTVRDDAEHISSFLTSTDVAADDAVIVIPAPASLTKSLVYAPIGAVKLTLRDSLGTVVDEVDLLDGIGGIEAPPGSFLLEARDAAGKVIGTGKMPMPEAPTAFRTTLEDWR